MKRYLFIDNFRGFSNAYIPIVDVNFLVGENSSGKTSVLSLLKLFSSSHFLMGKDFFNDEDVNFGHFSDMVSAHAEDRTYFRIGLIDEEANNKAGTSASGMLLTYREHAGIPQLSKLSRTMGNRCAHLRFEERQISYRFHDLPQGVTEAQKMASVVIPDWISEHSSDGPGYKLLNIPEGLVEVPIFLVLSWAVQSSKDKKGPSFEFPGPQAFPPEVVWVAPIRTKPRRTYDELQRAFSAEGSHTPYLIKKILDSSEAKKFQEFITRAGAASGLFQSIETKTFGSEVRAPFEVDVVLDDKALNLSTVGYGVSQSLPIFVELLFRPHGSVFAIQQPEVHLHPRAQAALGDVFFEMAIKDKKRFLIETHSDFTVDRFRMNYRKNNGHSRLNSQILFFERHNKMNTVTPLKIDSKGNLPSKQPDSYRRFFIGEEMLLLGL